MAKILLLETATEVCSAAIAVDGRIVALAEDPAVLSHTAVLTLQIEACSKQAGIALAELDAIALSRGPGAYTSLRVGASVAKGICYALDKPLLAVDTLEALALATASAPASAPATPHYFLPMLDARRQEVWAALYDPNLRCVLPAQPLILDDKLFENVVRASGADPAGAVFILSGNGSIKAKNVIFDERMVWGAIKKSSASFLAPLAGQIFQQNDFQDIAYFEPFYMKPPNITTPNKVW